MSLAVTFDTLKIAKRLKAVDVPPAQAEAEAEILSEVFETNLKELATKEDLHREIGDLRKDMDAKLVQLGTELRGEMKLMKWMLGVIVLSVVPLAIKTFLHL